jgi:hypothetical protein
MIELGNIFAVAKRKDRILVMSLSRRFPTVDLGPLDMDREDALNLAAHLLWVAEPKPGEFERVVEQIKSAIP